MATSSPPRQTGTRSAHLYVLDLHSVWHRATVSRSRCTITPEDDDGALLLQSCPDATTVTVIECSVWLFRYLLNEILSERSCRRQFIQNNRNCQDAPAIVLRLQPPAKELIDYEWNYLNEHTAYTDMELDHLTSWLSTLGGGYSALGDSMDQCASIAGRISIYQFRLALQFGDPPLVARSKLYMAIALIQKRRLRCAKYLTRLVYHEALAERLADRDERLINMCHGIWLKLQWSYTQRCGRARAA